MMKTRNLLIYGLLLLSLLAWPLLHASRTRATQMERAETITLTVAGQTRTALLFRNRQAAPANGAPLVLGFHGHGGRAEMVARRWNLQTLWPEAIVVYLQGLPGVAGITDKDGRLPGWQKNPGEMTDKIKDRDVAFTDAVLASVQKQMRVDPQRIYAVGHSNGARFVNVLWKMRGATFAAFCSAAAQGGLMIRGAVPRSLFALAGEQDPLVPFQGQLRSLEVARQVLQTDPRKTITNGYLQQTPGLAGTELVTYLHPGGHEFSPAALPLVVEFFKRNTRH